MVKEADPIMTALDVLGGAGIKASEKRPVDVIATDIATLNDIVFACGGIPTGKVIELYAKESVGKSTFAYWLIGQVQKRGGVAALWDAEGSYVPEYGAACGIDNEKLILPEFYHGEEALGQMKMVIATGAVDLLVGDAMPAFQPLALVEQVAGESKSMHQNLARAKMFTGFFNDLMGGFKIKPPGKNQKWIKNADGTDTHKLYDSNSTVIMINHAKDKVGVVYGERSYTPGGASINIASAIRLGMVHKKKDTTTKKVKGNKVTILNHKQVLVKAAKNKLGVPFGEAFIRMFPDGHIEPDDGADWDTEELGEFGSETETITAGEGDEDFPEV